MNKYLRWGLLMFLIIVFAILQFNDEFGWSWFIAFIVALLGQSQYIDYTCRNKKKDLNPFEEYMFYKHTNKKK